MPNYSLCNAQHATLTGKFEDTDNVRLWRTEPNHLPLPCLSWNRWSGHVAYIGGKNEAGETDLETVTREVQEESGLDLTSDAFLELGRLDDRELISTYNKQLMMILVPFGKHTESENERM